MNTTTLHTERSTSKASVLSTEEFRRIYQSLSGKMYSLCLRYIPDEVKATEVFQHSFSMFLMNLSHSNLSSCEEEARKTFVTGCLSYLNSHPIENDRMPNYSNFQGFNKKIGELPPAQQLALIQLLPKQERIVFNMYQVDGYEHKEIAQLLRVSVMESRLLLSGAVLWMEDVLSGS